MKESIQIVSANFLSYSCWRCAASENVHIKELHKIAKYVDGEYLVSPILTEIEHR